MKRFIFALLLVISSLSQATTIQISSGVEKKYKKQILNDFKVLENFKFKDVDPLTLKILGINELTGKTALAWLEERIHFIVEKEFNYQGRITILKENVSYPNEIKAPEGETKEHAEFDMGEVPPEFFMGNTGIWLYNVGKWNNTQYGITIPTAENKNPAVIPINSPRVGIIMIGNTLFGRDSNSEKHALAYSISRIRTYFHEARHSDGNGESLGFPHAECGYSYNMSDVCEANANGPYAVGLAIIKEMVKSCDECSASDKQYLLDYAKASVSPPKGLENTVLPFWDTTPEGL